MVKLVSSKPSTLQLVDSPLHIQDFRPYLGMSGLGHSCFKYLWLNFRWGFSEPDRISSRLNRLFSRGHREEQLVISELIKIGVEVTNTQAEVVTCFGHVKGHCDGEANNVPEAPKTPHLLEIKTMNDKSFKDTISKGVKSSKPVYYAQCQLYMKHFGYTRTLFIAVNKNDDSWYVERIQYDNKIADDLERKAEQIIMTEEVPHTPFKNTWYECKFCNGYSICHLQAKPMKNCRTCREGAPGVEGTWVCGGSETLSLGAQKLGCSQYKPLF
jgi:hypothetical protein